MAVTWSNYHIHKHEDCEVRVKKLTLENESYAAELFGGYLTIFGEWGELEEIANSILDGLNKERGNHE